MRVLVAALFCLAGGIAAASAQIVSPPAAPAVAQPSTPPQAEQQAAKPPEHQAAKPAEEPAVKPADQAVAKPVEQPAKPTEQQAAKPVEQPAAKPAEQTAAKPAEKAKEPAETTGSIPANQPATKPAEQTAAKPDEQPVDKADKKIAKVAEPACPGNPDAIGTSRVLTMAADDVSLLGVIQYKQSLPLADHEVVLTFDDGPIPPYTNSILDTLAANCVKATYFMVGEMARNYPYLVRRVYNEGHSIGTHTQHHPFAMQHLSMQRVASEVNGGIASVEIALGDPKALSPFFRIPGLGRTNAIEHFLEAKGLSTWSADIDTNDWWRGTTPDALVKRAMRRLNARGRGIILMHDIHPATALALPRLLKELKAAGYHVVHVVSAGERPNALPELVAKPIEKETWPRVLHAQAENGGASMSALRHRVKTVIASQPHRRHGRHRTTAKVDVTSTAMNERHTNF